MITIFHDRIWRNAHALFQAWRQANPSGFFINRKPGKESRLHDAQCHHLGHAQWTVEETGDSLTEKPKVCARTIEELEAWAADRNLVFRPCSDCRLDKYSTDILPPDKYSCAVERIVRLAESIALAEEFDEVTPDRVETTISRIVRDTKMALKVKELHRYRCQVCGTRITLEDGLYYAEAHHIRPLGKPHNGYDELGNLLCLCPNHHVEFDYRVSPIVLAELRSAEGHQIKAEHVSYHNALVSA